MESVKIKFEKGHKGGKIELIFSMNRNRKGHKQNGDQQPFHKVFSTKS